MARDSLFNSRVVFRAPTGDVSVGESISFSEEVGGDLSKFTSANFFLNVTNIEAPDGYDEIDFYFQTTYDEGGTWEDLANVHFDTDDDGVEPQAAIVSIGPAPAGVSVFIHSDQQLADNTNRDLPVGDDLRVVVVVAGTPVFAYSINLVLYG